MKQSNLTKREADILIWSTVAFFLIELLVTIGCLFELSIYFNWWELIVLPGALFIMFAGLCLYMGVVDGFTKDEMPR